MASDETYRMLDRLLDPVGRCLSPDAAHQLLHLRADAEAQARIDLLADRCNEGQLSEEEQAEYQAYVSVNQVIAILQAKARRVTSDDAAA